MADQATSAGGRSSIDPQTETPAAGAPASASTPAVPAPSVATAAQPAAGQPAGEQEPATTRTGAGGFGERGRMRRRLRFLRKARELAYRDLGGLVFEMQRVGERRDELVAAKLATLAAIDTELRALEDALGDRRELTILRESGIAACPRCAAIHGSEDRFCPSCGLAMGNRADRPIAAVAAPPAAGPGRPSTTPPGAPPPTAPPALFAPPVPAPPPAVPPAAPRPAGAGTPASAPPAPDRPPAPSPPDQPATPPAAPAQATRQVTDERPTEIIRPADGKPASDS